MNTKFKHLKEQRMQQLKSQIEEIITLDVSQITEEDLRDLIYSFKESTEVYKVRKTLGLTFNEFRSFASTLVK